MKREKSNKHNAENFIQIGCKIRKLWHFKVLLNFTEQLYAHPGRYANEGTDDVIHSLFLLYFIMWNMKYLNFFLIIMWNKVLFLIEYMGSPLLQPIMIQWSTSLLLNLQKLKYCRIQTIKYKRNSEWVTSPTLSFAYHCDVHITVLWKISETLKIHNFLIWHPILMKFSVVCLLDFSLIF